MNDHSEATAVKQCVGGGGESTQNISPGDWRESEKADGPPVEAAA